MKGLKKIQIAISLSVLCGLFWGCLGKDTQWNENGVKAKGFNESFNDLDAFNQGITPNIGGNSMRESPAIQEATMRPYQVAGKWYYPEKVSLGDKFDGYASWYGPDFHSKKTSNGETYNMYAHTAAHKTFPMNTVVKVLNVENGKSTIVRINDRGPFVEGRIIDLSSAAAHDIDMVKVGTAKVRLEVIGFGGVINKDAKVQNVESEDILSNEFKVANTPKSVNGGDFAIQVGAFRRYEGAQITQERYSHMPPYQSVIKEFELNGAPIYRVFLRGFQSEQEARDFLKKNTQIQGGFFIRD
ncbi:septal ring lytic transglycosylase RlpA family protein [Helicobacter sp. MIT 03-1614]|jgi:rare lipoprotein A|uniref:Probable endolytic peptidoglycan transglycosylase RlpA n=1 Tax=Helicobacter hepaticus (strain ATCC 51449 / 3B1) TaxID=235279 RepID=Q7VGJ7_HELHP|nr:MULTISPECIES: septal ring lytic transglycosylase RlpA family protein [Helicobacter]AAP77921.1 rare lipoprotein A [Helicobacter hepaticus ATCC 51449]TLD90768.1 septal ring lytic transglycosylase RlpA family protein [Helicobacter sp. MIT 03-1614]